MNKLLFALALLLSFPAFAGRIDHLTINHENGSYALGMPTYVNARVLAANTAESFTVPTGAQFVSFASNCDFYANYTTTASVPGSDITDGSANELNPLVRIVDGAVTSISVITAATSCIITTSFYM